MAAATSPNNTCRNPEYQILLPVNKVIAAPIKNSPKALEKTLIKMAEFPFKNIKGKTGMMAPTANNTKEKTAASSKPFLYS